MKPSQKQDGKTINLEDFLSKSVLVVGGGGREHAIVDALSRSRHVRKIYCAPGNAGIAAQAECVPIKDTEIDKLLDFVKEKGVDLTVVGPEASLSAGIVDLFTRAGKSIHYGMLSSSASDNQHFRVRKHRHSAPEIFESFFVNLDVAVFPRE